MPNVSQKLKILHLARIFLEQTDEDHGLSTPRLIEELAAVGVSVERKALYRDIDALRAFGLDIETIKGRPVSYALKSRAFTFGELSLIVDAVSSSRFLTEEKAEELIDSIRRLGSRHQASRLAGNVHVDRRVTRQSDSVYANVDVLREALRSNRKIEFSYFKTDVRKNRVERRSGRRYLLTPVAIVYSDGFYYLVTYSDKHDGFANYRVDRMEALRISDEPATRNEAIAGFDVRAYRSGSFGMFSGEEKTVKLKCLNRFIGVMLDRFGSSLCLFPADNEHFYLDVDVVVSPQFFSWVFSLEGDVRIVNPPEVCEAFEKQIHKFID